MNKRGFTFKKIKNCSFCKYSIITSRDKMVCINKINNKGMITPECECEHFEKDRKM